MAKFHKVRYPILFRTPYNLPKQLKMTLRMSPIIFKNKKRLPPPGSIRGLKSCFPYSYRSFSPYPQCICSLGIFYKPTEGFLSQGLIAPIPNAANFLFALKWLLFFYRFQPNQPLSSKECKLFCSYTPSKIITKRKGS